MILGIDAAGKTVSVAVYNEKEQVCLSKRLNLSSKGHAETLMPLIDECLNEASLKLKDISLISVTSGPGSFTGVRIGVSVVKGLCFATDIPVCAISSLEAAAYNAKEKKGLTLALMSARNKRFYCALFDFNKNERLWEDSILSYDEILSRIGAQKVSLTGEGAEEFYSLAFEAAENLTLCENLYTDAENVCKASLTKEKISAKMLAPFYLGLSQADQARINLEKKQAEALKK